MRTDEFGRKIEAESKTASQTARITRNSDPRDWSGVTTGLTMDRVMQYIELQDIGEVGYAISMFRKMIESDATLMSVINNRKMPILEAPFKIVPGDGPKGKKAAKLVDEQIRSLPDLEAVFSSLLEAIYDGVSIAEIVWDGTEVADLIPAPSEFQRWDLSTGQLLLDLPKARADQIRGDMQITNNGFFSKGNLINLEANKWIIHSPRMKSGPPQTRGLMRTIAVYWVIKHYVLQDWAAFVEVFGMPIRIGRFPSFASEEDVAKMQAALESLGSDASALLPEGFEIQIIQPGAQIGGAAGTQSFEAITDYCDKEMTKAILGQTLTTDTTNSTGTFAAARIHAETMKGLLRGDARALAVSLRRDLFSAIVKFNLPGAPIPHIQWDNLEDPVDELTRMQVVMGLVRHVGLAVSKKQMYEMFKLAEPETEEDTLLGRDFDDFNEEAQAKLDVAAITAEASLEKEGIKQGAPALTAPATPTQDETASQDEEK